MSRTTAPHSIAAYTTPSAPTAIPWGSDVDDGRSNSSMSSDQPMWPDSVDRPLGEPATVHAAVRVDATDLSGPDLGAP